MWLHYGNTFGEVHARPPAIVWATILLPTAVTRIYTAKLNLTFGAGGLGVPLAVEEMEAAMETSRRADEQTSRRVDE